MNFWASLELFFFQAEDGIRDVERSRGLGDVYKRQVSSYGVVVSDENGRIKAFQEKPTVDQALSDSINTGIYLFEPEIFNYIPSAEKFDIGADLFPKLVEMDLPFFALPMDFEWVDIGKVPDYWSAIRNVLQGKVRPVSYTHLTLPTNREV